MMRYVLHTYLVTTVIVNDSFTVEYYL